MKKLIVLFSTMMLVLLCVSAMADVTVDAAHFPDTTFRNYVAENYDTNGDGVLSDAETLAVKEIHIYIGIDVVPSSLRGIEYFPALTSLYCQGLDLKELDVSSNTRLTELLCDENMLTSLDVRNCRDLEVLQCAGNRLSSLDVSQNRKLRSLYVGSHSVSYGENNLKKLDVSNHPVLEYLDCCRNQLKKLNLKGCPALKYLACHSNQLTTVDVSDSPILRKLVQHGTREETELLPDADGWEDGTGWWLLVDPCVTVKAGSMISEPLGPVLVQSIRLNKSKVSLKRGKTYQLKVKRLFPSNVGNREVQWASSAPEIATVSGNGKVKALKKGVCTITCTAKDGGGAYATCVIRVR